MSRLLKYALLFDAFYTEEHDDCMIVINLPLCQEQFFIWHVLDVTVEVIFH